MIQRKRGQSPSSPSTARRRSEANPVCGVNRASSINKAFTLIELLVIMGIILTLASIAISQGGSTQRSLSYSEAFNRTVDLVQKARSLATTSGTENEKTVYGVHFDLATDPPTALLFENTTATTLETRYTYPDNVAFELPAGCSSPVEINFVGASSTMLYCGTMPQADPDAISRADLTITIKRKDDSSKEKVMYIHKSVGIPQVVN